MKVFRVFFKDYGTSVDSPTSSVIELKEKKFLDAFKKAEKMGVKKHKRVVMIAECSSSQGFPGKL